MQEFPLLSLILILPLIGALFLSFVGSEEESHNAKKVGIWCACATFILTLFMVLFFEGGRETQFLESYPIVPSLSIMYKVGVDGISFPFLVLTAFLTPVCLLVTWQQLLPYGRFYMACFLLLETCLMGAFSSLNLFLFYMFFEGSLIPLFFLIGLWGGKERIQAVFQFFLYTVAGSFLLLSGLFLLFHWQGSLDLAALFKKTLDLAHEKILWWLFFGGLAIKMPLWPFHTWLPKAHGEAPTAVSMMLAGVVLKIAGYAFLRFLVPLFPHASDLYTPFVMTLSCVGMITLSFVAFAQKDMKRLIAYASVAHMALVTFGIFTKSIYGFGGAIFHMISHGLTSSGLFLAVGILYHQYGTYNIQEYRGLWSLKPLWSWLFLLLGLSAIGVPLTSGFVGEFLVVLALGEHHKVWAILCALGLFLSACYMAWLWARILFSKPKIQERNEETFSSEVGYVILGVILCVIFLLGLYPSFVMGPIETSLEYIGNILYPSEGVAL
jgi:NADH-quinone oxidoreductase subunit M